MQDTPLLFVIVLYQIELEESKTFVSLNAALKYANKKAELMIYDNSNVCNPISNSYQYWNITYFWDQKNSGVSKAYNKAAELAEEKYKPWLLLLDQDTTFPKTSVEAYLSALDKFPDQYLFAPVMITSNGEIISPGKFRYMRGFYADQAVPGINSLKNKSLINAGICILLTTYKNNGGYNELIKLDFSDHDFIRRLKKNIGDEFVIIDLVVTHQLSTADQVSVQTDKLRFNYYLEGSKQFAQSSSDTILLRIHAFLRASKLTIIHRDIGFLIMLIKAF